MREGGIKREAENFDLGQICDSGQCFRMERRGEGEYLLLAGERYLEAEQRGRECVFFCEEEEYEGFWREYFDLDTDYGAYIKRINPRDAYLNEAAREGRGIRILRQDLWETTVSFLISQQNNIPRIRGCIQRLCERYGEERLSGTGKPYRAFPGPKAFAGLREDALRECGLGYRSGYVVRAARSPLFGEELPRIREASYEEARAALLGLYGVGEKVADCICLFSLHHLEAFPVDVHIQRVLRERYRRGFPRRRYQGFQGVLQQYIFYRELKKKGD